jgi:hypothetical protein
MDLHHDIGCALTVGTACVAPSAGARVVPAPLLRLTSLAISPDTGTSDRDFITNSPVVQLFGTALFNPGDQLEVSVDGSSWVLAQISGDAWSVSLALTEGTGLFRIRLRDEDGGLSAEFFQGYVIDRSAPDSTSTSVQFSSDTGRHATDLVTQIRDQDISGQLDRAAAVDERVEVSIDGGLTWLPARLQGRAWELASVRLADDGFVSVRLVDQAGNVSLIADMGYVVDAIAPTLHSAYAVGDTLLLDFRDEVAPGKAAATALDSFSAPAPSSLQVSVNGVPLGVTDVELSPDGASIRLKLSRALQAGEAVTVSYAPSASNAAERLKDVAGNDSAGFLNVAVANRSVTAPAPPSDPDPAPGAPAPVRPSVLQARAGGDLLWGTSRSEVFLGSDGPDVFVSAGGSDQMRGRAGRDVGVFGGSQRDYVVERRGEDFHISHIESGSTTVVSGLERVAFDDGVFAIDVASSSWALAGIYQAALGRRPDSSGLAYYEDLLDRGESLTSIAAHVLSSDEFLHLAAGSPASNDEFVEGLYIRGLHRPADFSGLEYHLRALDALALDAGRVHVLLGVAQSPEMLFGLSDLYDFGFGIL